MDRRSFLRFLPNVPFVAGLQAKADEPGELIEGKLHCGNCKKDFPFSIRLDPERPLQVGILQCPRCLWVLDTSHIAQQIVDGTWPSPWTQRITKPGI